MLKEQTSAASKKIRTMQEFSAVSGISRPTLSRFFNDPQSVRPTSRERIEQAMKRFSYRPNLFAVNFNRRNPKTLGILVPSLTDPFFAGLVQHLETLALQAGYWTIILTAQGCVASEARAVTTLLSLKVAGAVVIPLGYASRIKPYRELAAAMPVVFLDSRVEARAPFVGTDNAQSIRLVVTHLLQTGRVPVYFGMPEVNQNARERRLAYCAVLEERGLAPRVIALPGRDWDFEKVAYEEASRLFLTGSWEGEAIMCANDRIAFGVLAAASQAGLTIGAAGNGLRIAGYDDHPLSRYACPPLTTVAQDNQKLATVSLDMLLSGITANENVETGQKLEADLRIRASA